jgi:ribA/ribD-fused uncharacterized protein
MTDLERIVGNNHYTVEGFVGQYKFLSNFYPSIIVDEFGISYSSNENYYQSRKTSDINIKKQISLMSAGEAKSFSKKLELPKNWSSIKLNEMLVGLRKKFQHKDLSQMLIDTNDLILVEMNHWYDNYWGIRSQDGMGQNHLGRLLMQVREEIKFINNSIF